jgi:hypothetical protein
MDFRRFMGQSAWRPVPPCGGLRRPVPPVAAGLDPLYIKIRDAGAPGLEAWMPGCWMLAGLEEVTEVTARWGEVIGRNSHTLELQEIGGFLCVSAFLLVFVSVC